MGLLRLPPYAMLAGASAAAMGAAAGYPYVNSEAATLVAAMSVAPNDTRKGLIDTLIGAWKTAGVWTLMDICYVLAAHDEQAGRLNWKSPGTFTCTAVNSPTFTTDRGFTGNGTTSWLNTGWDEATNAVQLTQNSAHLGAYMLTDSANGNQDWGNSGNSRIRAQPSTLGNLRLTSGTALFGDADGVTVPFHHMGIRRVSTTIRLWRDGVERKTGAATSAALSSTDWLIGGGPSDRQIAAVHNGGALDDTQAAAIYTPLYTYMVAVGADT